MHPYRPLKTNIHSSSLILIFANVTNFHILEQRRDGYGNKNTEFNKGNFQIVLKMIKFDSNLKATLKADNPGQKFWDDLQNSVAINIAWGEGGCHKFTMTAPTSLIATVYKYPK